MDLDLNLFSLDIFGASVDVKYCRLVILIELIVEIVDNQAGLSNGGIADEHNFYLLIFLWDWSRLDRLHYRLRVNFYFLYWRLWLLYFFYHWLWLRLRLRLLLCLSRLCFRWRLLNRRWIIRLALEHLLHFSSIT